MSRNEEHVPTLTADQKRLLEQLKGRELVERSDWGIERIASGTAIPLNRSQARIWFFGRLYPDSTEYNSFGVLHFARLPADDVIRRAVRTSMDRHDALRVRVFERDQMPWQATCEGLDAPVEFRDLRALSPEEAERQAKAIGDERAAAPFDPAVPPLFRLVVCRLPNDENFLIFVFHHIIADGWSVGIVCQELAAQLGGRALPQPPQVRFVDYVAWRRDHELACYDAADLEYWEQQLGGELPVLDLPKDRPRRADGARKGATIPCTVPTDVFESVRRIATEEQTTRFVVLLAAYKVLLLRLTGQADLVVGAPVAGREHPATSGVVGCFVNTVALRTDLGGDLRFRDVVRRVHLTVAAAQDHQSVPFEEVVQRLGLPRNMQINPVFQTMFAVQNTPASNMEGTAARFSELLLESNAAKFDLTVSLTESAHDATGFFEYASELFDNDTAARYVMLFERLLGQLVAEPDARVRAHSLTTPAERKHILFGLNRHKRPECTWSTMAGPFEAQVRRAPEALALVGHEGELSYAELNARANRLAEHLRRSGIGRESFVGICMHRSFALVEAVYAVAKTGATYVPLDPELPDGRLAFMLEDTRPLAVLVTTELEVRVAPGPWQVVVVDAEAASWSHLPAHDVPCHGPPSHLVHLLYTSGSTGRPKAVAYPIEGALAEIFWLHESYPLTPDDVNIFQTSFGFDVSIWELFWTLYAGGRLAIGPVASHRDPVTLARVVEEHEVTRMFLTPSMLEAFLEVLPPSGGRSLRTVIAGGEAVTPHLRDAFFSRLDARLVQGYGPTEAGCVTDMLVKPSPGDPVVPLGRPAPNFRLYVLDDDLEPLPIGVSGEAYIAGEVGIARCYHRRPALTAERFLPDPYGPPGSRIYRTGDLCRYRPDGLLEHLGRRDRQLKLRGARIELAEIESVLAEHDAVARCVVLHIDDDRGARLIAFAVPYDDASVDLDEFLERARSQLPRHMIPAQVVSMRELPTTVNGKLDHVALVTAARAERQQRSRSLVPPANEVEARLKSVFERILGVDDISVTDSFFDLGGHSFLSFKLIHECGQVFGKRPTVPDVFASPSVRELARAIDSAATQGACLVPITEAPGRPLVVFVHAAAGSALPFFELGRVLGDTFATYALESPSSREGMERPSVEDLAALYVEEIDTIRGFSPVVLAGWSMGGCVALEMARLWKPRMEVAGLIMLDTWLPPNALDDPSDRAQTRAGIEALDVLGEELATYAESELADFLDELDRNVHRNRTAFIEYVPTRIEIDIDYLRATEGGPSSKSPFPACYIAGGRDWSHYVRSVAYCDVPGDHGTMMAMANHPTMARTIRRIIEERLSYSTV